MNILKNIFQKNNYHRNNEIKSYYQPLGKAVWSDRNYEMFAKEGCKRRLYQKCSWL